MATAASPPHHRLYAILLAFPVALFPAALVSDIAYVNSAEIQWTNFSSWLIAGALLVGAPVLLWALVRALRAPAWRGPSLVHFALVATMWAAGLLNAFQHSRDGWSSVGTTGLLLSILTSAAALAAGWTGFSARPSATGERKPS